MARLTNALRVLFFTVFLIAVISTGFLIAVPAYVVSQKRLLGLVHRYAFVVLAAGVELILGVQYDVRTRGGLSLPVNKPVLVITNHPTRLDWLLLLPALVRLVPLQKLLRCDLAIRFVAKGELAKTPVIGTLLKLFGNVFMSRHNAAQDIRALQAAACTLRDAATSDRGIQHFLVIFPEGTDASPSNRLAAQQFARERHLPVLRHLLYPRRRGLEAMFQVLGNCNSQVQVVDVTYVPHPPVMSTELEFLKRGLLTGCVPARISVRVGDGTGFAAPDGLYAEWQAKDEEYSQVLARATDTSPGLSLAYLLVLSQFGALLGLCAWLMWTAPMWGFIVFCTVYLSFVKYKTPTL